MLLEKPLAGFYQELELGVDRGWWSVCVAHENHAHQGFQPLKDPIFVKNSFPFTMFFFFLFLFLQTFLNLRLEVG